LQDDDEAFGEEVTEEEAAGEGEGQEEEGSFLGVRVIGTDEVEHGDDEPYRGELTLSERSALFGSVMLAPAGMPGLIVGGLFGAGVGYLTEKVDRAAMRVATAIHEVRQTDQRNAESMLAASEHLKGLNQVSVQSEDAEEAARLTEELLEFLAAPENRRCADCACELPNHNEAWASLVLGVIVCVDCAAVHRSLGVGVTRIKSIVFDVWDAPMVHTLLSGGGNANARARYLLRLPRGYAEPTKGADDEQRKAFIRTKYVGLRWADAELKAARKAELAQREKVGGSGGSRGSRGGRSRAAGGGPSRRVAARKAVPTKTMASLGSDDA
jgi:hypothetical protein